LKFSIEEAIHVAAVSPRDEFSVAALIAQRSAKRPAKGKSSKMGKGKDEEKIDASR